MKLGVLKYPLVLLCVVITSMFFFPFEFRFWEGMNTKRMLAALALVILFMKMVQKREFKIDKDFLFVSILAGLVSFCGLISVTYNNTPDYTYATYITSCWVWWAAAYTACQCIKAVHGKITWVLVINYLVAVCVAQCALALAMDYNSGLKQTVNSVVFQSDEDYVFSGGDQRLYGIGMSLDVAGSRFAAVLVMIVYALGNSDLKKQWYNYLLYFLAFIFITVAGNMVARTTIVGLVVGVLYLIYVTFKQIKAFERNYFTLWGWLVGLLLICVPILVHEYQTDSKVHEQLRFGFEGFFNLAEGNGFIYASNEKLTTMYVWPDNLKTWFIGDGYFESAPDINLYYTGSDTPGGFYKDTDVGYLRFIFYFGVIGLFMFCWFMVRVGHVCIQKFPAWRVLFLLLLLTNFVVWFKVSTDIFLVFAMFLCLEGEKETELLSLPVVTHEDHLSVSGYV